MRLAVETRYSLKVEIPANSLLVSDSYDSYEWFTFSSRELDRDAFLAAVQEVGLAIVAAVDAERKIEWETVETV